MASDPLPFNLHDQLEPLECNSRQTRRGSASPQSAHTSSYILVKFVLKSVRQRLIEECYMQFLSKQSVTMNIRSVND